MKRIRLLLAAFIVLVFVQGFTSEVFADSSYIDYGEWHGHFHPPSIITINGNTGIWVNHPSVTLIASVSYTHIHIPDYPIGHYPDYLLKYSLYSGSPIPDGAWHSGNSATVTAEGITKVTFCDGSTNVSRSVEVLIDRTAPILNIAGINEAWQSVDSVTVSAQASDGLSGIKSSEYSFDNSSWQPGTKAVVTKEGTNTIWFRATDNAGNVTVKSTVVRLDRTKPEITVAGENESWQSVNSVTLTGSAIDIYNGVQPIEYSYDGNLWQKGNEVVVTDEGETEIWFKAADSLGNTAVKKTTVRLDRTPPAIEIANPAVETSDLNKATISCSLNDAVSGVDNTSVEYKVDEGEWLPGASIEVKKDGVTTISFRARDKAGNQVEKSDKVYLDGVLPTIAEAFLGANATDESIRLMDGDYTDLIDIYAWVYGSDVRRGKKINPKEYIYTVRQNPSKVGRQYHVSGDKMSFKLESLAKGSNYIFIKAVDAAGNESEEKLLIIKIGNGIPGTPSIRSKTHPYANKIYEAVNDRNPMFQITSNNPDLLDTKEYIYTLKKGGKILYDNQTTAQPVIKFSELADNLSGEFYELSVLTVGGNGKVSEKPAKYIFRIDSTPPDILTITSQSHTVESEWYPDSVARFEWNKPRDFTGIRSYYYKLEKKEISINDTDGWIASEETYAALDLHSVLPDVTKGQCYFAVWAEDYSGNRQFDTMKVSFDTEKPYLSAESSEMLRADQPENIKNCINLSWSVPMDNVAVGETAICISDSATGIDNAQWIYKSKIDTYHLFTNLENKKTYIIKLKIDDLAGNTRTYLKTATADGTSPAAITINFSANIAGYTVEGSSAIDGSGNTATLVVPSGLGADVDRIPFDTNLVMEGCEFVSGESSRTFNLNLHGYNMQVKGILLNQGGLTLKEAAYRPLNSNTEIVLKNIKISASPEFTIIKSDISDTPIKEIKLLDFVFSDIVKSGFQSNQWVIYEGKMDTKQYNCFTESNNEKNYLLPVKNAAFSADGRLKSGMIATDFILRYGKNSYKIKEGNCLFKNGKLLINEAKIGESSVKLLYMAVSKDGLPTEEDGFRFEIAKENTSYFLQLESLRLQSGVLMLAKGNVDTNSGIKMLLENLPVEDGIIAYSENGVKLNLSDTFNPVFSGNGSKVSGFRADLDGKSFEAKLWVGEKKGIMGGYYTLKDGSISLVTDKNEIKASLQGGIDLGKDVGPDLEGIVLQIEEAELDKDCNILRVKAETKEIPRLDVLQDTKIRNGLFYALYSPEKSSIPEIGIEGSIDIPGIPQIITGGQGMPINKLTFSEDGKIKMFEVSPQKQGEELTGELFVSKDDEEGNHFKNAVLTATYDTENNKIVYEMSGTLVLSDRFQGQLPGSEIYIEKIYFGSNGNIYGVNAQGTLPSRLGFIGNTVLDGATVSLEPDESGNDLEIVLKGRIRVPSNIKGLSELYLDAEHLSFGRNGVIKQIIAGRRIEGMQTFIDNLSLKDAQITAYTDSFQDKLIVSANGTAVFTLDAGEVYVPSMELNVNTLAVDQYGNIEDMSIGANLPGTRSFIGKSLLKDAAVTVSKDIDSTLIADLKGTVIIPKFINDNDAVLSVNKFTVEQNGSIRAIDIKGSIPGEEKFLGGTTLKDCTAGLVKDNKDTPVQVELGGTIVLPEMEIQSLSHLELQIQSLRFDMQGDLKRVSAVLQFQKEFELLNGIKLRNGRIELSGEEGKTYQIGISGTMLMPSTAPGNLAGAELTINKFVFDLNGKLIALDTQLGLENVDLIGAVKIKKGLVQILKPETGSLEFSISGTLLLPENAPGTLKSAEIPIKIFKIDTKGDIKAFEASVAMPGDRKLFGDFVRAKDLNINASFSKEKEMEFGINGEVYFNGAASDSGGFNMVLRAFTITQSGTVKELDLSANNVNANLFGLVELSDGSVSIVKNNTTGENLLDIKGVIKAGSKFPEGLAGNNITLNRLVIDLNGEIREFENSIDEISIYSGMKLRNGKLYVENESGNYIVGISGQIITGASFPKDFRGKVIDIEKFKIDKQGSIHELKMGIKGIDTDFFDALYIKNGSFSAIKDGNSGSILWSITGDISLGSMFPESIRSGEITLEKFTIATTGEIKDLSATINGTTTFDIFCNLKAIANKINISTNGLSVTGSIEFPSNYPEGLAETKIAIKKLALGWNGKIKDIEAAIGHMIIKPGGFNVGIDNLSIEEDKVSIGKCTLTLPDNMKNRQLEIRNATINKNGKFSGEFTVSDIEQDFGFGLLNLKEISLNTDSKEIVFKKASLTFSKDLGNIVVGLNGVKVYADGLHFTGGAFRIPNMKISEALAIQNAYVDFNFDKDFYLKGGATVIIADMGSFSGYVSFVKKSSTYPIGLKYAEFTFSVPAPGIPIANTGLFINTITGGIAFGPPDEVPAQLKWIFNSGMRMKMGVGFQDRSGGNIVKGNADMWLDVKNVAMAMRGNVTVLRGLATGEVLSTISKNGMSGTVMLDMRFARGKVEFYFFNYNGSPRVSGSGSVTVGIRAGTIVNKTFSIKIWKKRFKKTIKIPDHDYWVGGVGADFGMFTNGRNGLCGYIKVPVWGKVGIYVSKNDFDIGNVSSYHIYRPNGAAFVRGNYKLDSKSRLKNLSTDDDPDNEADTPGMMGTSVLMFRVSGNNGAPVERIVLAAVGLEPGQEVILISPSGKSYGTGSQNIEVSYEDDTLLLAVLKPEAGEWKIEVHGGSGNSEPCFEMYGVNSAPEISVENPVTQGKSAVINGSAINSSKGDKVELYLSENDKTYSGTPVAEAVLDENGKFKASTDLTTVSNGSYYVVAVLTPSSGLPPVQSSTKDVLKVNLQNQRLKPVNSLIAAENKEGNIEVRFEDMNGSRTRGFNLYIKNTTSGEIEKVNLGYVTDTYVSGYSKGDILLICVVPYDSEYIEGERSKEVKVSVGSKMQRINEFDTTPEELKINLISGAASDNIIRLKNPLAQKAGTAFDYAEIKMVDLPEGINISFDKTIDITSTEPEINLHVEAVGQGEYTVNAEVQNRGNREICKHIKIVITVNRPDIIVDDSVVTVKGKKASTVELNGLNFDDRTKVYLNGMMLKIVKAEEDVLQIAIPENLDIGTHKLNVVGGNSDEHAVELEVLEPQLLIQPSRVKAYSTFGAIEIFSFTGNSINGFEGTSKLKAEIPKGWTANFDNDKISPKDICNLTLKVPEKTAAGDYTVVISSDNGQKIPLSVYVYPVDSTKQYASEPYITGISNDKGIAGDRIKLYGGNLKYNCKAYVGGKSVPVINCTYNEIELVIQPDTISGDIVLDINGQKYTAGKFNMLSEIFINISPEKPDGKNGTYRVKPQIELWSMEYNAGKKGIYYRINYGQYRKYTGSFTLSNGKSRIEAYSIDSKGNKNSVKVWNIKCELKQKSGVSTVFNDIKGHWAEKSIISLYENSLVTGYPDKTIMPEREMTRAELLMMIVKALNIEPSKDTDLKYVESVPKWLDKGYIKTAVDKGILKAYKDNLLRMNEKLTRAQATDIMLKAFAIKEKDIALTLEEKNAIEKWAKASYKDYEPNTYFSSRYIKRSEIFTLLNKCIQIAEEDKIKT